MGFNQLKAMGKFGPEKRDLGEKKHTGKGKKMGS